MIFTEPRENVPAWVQYLLQKTYPRNWVRFFFLYWVRFLWYRCTRFHETLHAQRNAKTALKINFFTEFRRGWKAIYCFLNHAKRVEEYVPYIKPGEKIKTIRWYAQRKKKVSGLLFTFTFFLKIKTLYWKKQNTCKWFRFQTQLLYKAYLPHTIFPKYHSHRFPSLIVWTCWL